MISIADEVTEQTIAAARVSALPTNDEAFAQYDAAVIRALATALRLPASVKRQE